MAWAVYKNGNSITRINLEDGTKIRQTVKDKFNLDFPESMDLNIGNKCDGGCPFCYINASPNGINAELLDVPFVDTLHPYTECAINGNSVDHPQLIPFLEKLYKKRVIANLTVNQIHFERKEELIDSLISKKLIKGLGISLKDPTHDFIRKVQKYPNVVIHVINGVVTPAQIEALKDNDLKLLILGYKTKGRGVDYSIQNYGDVKENSRWLYDSLPNLVNHFKVMSFDNLALAQLNVKRIVSDEEFDELFQGEEGSCSMFIDLVTGKFGVSSLCEESEMHPIMDNVDDMFAVVKKDAGFV